MQELKSDNLRLKDENEALIRVISKLSRTPASSSSWDLNGSPHTLAELLRSRGNWFYRRLARRGVVLKLMIGESIQRRIRIFLPNGVMFVNVKANLDSGRLSLESSHHQNKPRSRSRGDPDVLQSHPLYLFKDFTKMLHCACAVRKSRLQFSKSKLALIHFTF